MTATQKKLLAIAVGGGLSSLTAAGFDPSKFNLDGAGVLRLGAVFLIGAVSALVHLYMPAPEKTDAGDPMNGRTVGGIALRSLVLMASMLGCSKQQGTQVAQEIVTWTPALINAVDTIASTGALLLPADAAIFAAVTAGFKSGAGLVVDYSKAYLANPSASVLANLQTAVTTLEQDTNKALLEVAKITKPQSQQLALAAVNGFGTIVMTILGLVQSISTKAQLRMMQQQVTIQLATVRRLMDRQKLELQAARYGNRGVTVDGFFAYEAAHGF